MGNKEFEDNNGNTIVKTIQYFNYNQAKQESEDGGNSIGTNALHEILESYIGGKDSPNARKPVGRNSTLFDFSVYLNAHMKASNLDPQFKEREKVSTGNNEYKYIYTRDVYEVE